MILIRGLGILRRYSSPRRKSPSQKASSSLSLEEQRPVKFPLFKSRLQGVLLWSKNPTERGSLLWLAKRIVYSFLTLRFPIHIAISEISDFWKVGTTRLSLEYNHYLKESHAHFPKHKRNVKVLYASPVGESGKPYLEKVIGKFKGSDVDFLIFVYDGTQFDEPIFTRCNFIYEKGLKWHFMKKYLIPANLNAYDYVLPWDDDIDISSFDLSNFLDIMQRNNLEVAQPSLTHDSYYTHGATLARMGLIGRYTDFVEIMAQVYTKEAWAKFWPYMETDWNHWGWGYDTLANSLCNYSKMGIVDCESIRHTKSCAAHEKARREYLRYLNKYPNIRRASFISYGKMKS